MKKQLLNEEFIRMQKLAGIIVENESEMDRNNNSLNEDKSTSVPEDIKTFVLDWGIEPFYEEDDEDDYDVGEEMGNLIDLDFFDYDDERKEYEMCKKIIDFIKKRNGKVTFYDEEFKDVTLSLDKDDENIIKVNWIKQPNTYDDYDLDAEFKNSPGQSSYEAVLDIIDSYEDEDILNDFKNKFPKGKPINKEDYIDFAQVLIDDMSEADFIKANWISIFDEDVFKKAGLI